MGIVVQLTQTPSTQPVFKGESKEMSGVDALGSREKFRIMKGHAPGLEEGQAKPQAPQFYRQILVSDEFDTQS